MNNFGKLREQPPRNNRCGSQRISIHNAPTYYPTYSVPPCLRFSVVGSPQT